jgi:ADP-ribose pyrophosphatase YjhB (NUDIX family)
MKPIRNAAKAIIIERNQVLLIKNRNEEEGIYFSFPGGGQEYGEQLSDTIIRECLEEIGEEIEVGQLMYVREYIGENHASEAWHMDMHQVEFYFRCTLTAGSKAVLNASSPDSEQIGVEWVGFDKLDAIPIYPRTVVNIIKNGHEQFGYLGDVI